jgi:hypothetical protein
LRKKKDEYLEETLPEKILKLRSDPETFKNLFCGYLLPCVYGWMRFRTYESQKEVSKFTTASDEAWTILVVENNWDYWLWLARGKKDHEGKDQAERPKFRYTKDKTEKGRNSGWSENGIKRYNELMALVKQDRKENEELEVEYLEEKTVEREEREGLRKRKRAQETNNAGREMPVVDLEGMDGLFGMTVTV